MSKDKRGSWHGMGSSDRSVREKSQQMWQDTTKTQSPAATTKPLSDLDRAMHSEIDAMHGAPKATGTLGQTIAGSPQRYSDQRYDPAVGGKLDRPIIPGGCHHTGAKLFTVLSDGKRLYGAQAHSIAATSHLGLILDCAGLLKPRPKFVAKATAPRFRTLDLAAYPDVVTLAWPDMSAPTQVGFKFWARLRDLLPEATAVCCMGGHGRTGTALACLLVADGLGADAAIKCVRTEHCPRAIETQGQVQYIKDMAAERDRLTRAQGLDTHQGGK